MTTYYKKFRQELLDRLEILYPGKTLKQKSALIEFRPFKKFEEFSEKSRNFKDMQNNSSRKQVI